MMFLIKLLRDQQLLEQRGGERERRNAWDTLVKKDCRSHQSILMARNAGKLHCALPKRLRKQKIPS